ncbi:hypothetical protein ACJMK2_024442 [Sinanodonta woodiana]|uniref:Uncharacterized protein n=1 Tax=Sinanodonta woodiana TaxID=1069815 RepID=A0ABD3XDF1_SINWO
MCRKRHHGLWFGLFALGCLVAAGNACPIVCQCVGMLYIYCDSRQISDSDLTRAISEIPTEATYLDLHGNLLLSIEVDLLYNHKRLLYLDLSFNKFVEIVPNTFQFHDQMQKLYLHGNNLSVLYNNTFTGLTSLKELRLSDNHISVVERFAFRGLSALSVLLIDGNKLRSIAVDTFASLGGLTLLDLSHNAIDSIQDYSFTNLIILQKLILSYNNVKSISASTFAGLNCLQELRLNHNTIESLHIYEFDSFRDSLKLVALDNNKIKMLNSDVFKRMIHLERINLSFNELSQLGSNVFQGLQLEELLLQGNKLVEIQRNIFSGTTKISSLDLSQNTITKVYVGAFDSFAQTVFDIRLDGNQLTDILVGLFGNMNYLQSLNLARNYIMFIENGAFSSLKSLQTLNLSGNQMTSFTPSMLSGASNIRVLDLHCNPLNSFQGFKFQEVQSMKISLNLTVKDVTHKTARVTWPYKDGSQIYWSLELTCLFLDSLNCTFQSRYITLPPYQMDAVIEDLSPLSRYYVCVNPSFVSTTIEMHQCGIIVTQSAGLSVTDPVPVTVAKPSTSMAVFQHSLDSYVVVSEMLILIQFFNL